MKRKRAKSKSKPIKKTVKPVKRKKKGGNEDDKQRRKFKKGGRIEAYTMGEALDNKDWPFNKK